MKKVDTKLTHPEIYNPDKGKINVIEVPKMRFLAIEGYGKPNEKNFQDATQTIYNVAYAIKYLIRKELNIDFKVMPLEVIWDLDNPDKEFGWTMMIMQPHFVTQKHYARSFEILRSSDKTLPLEEHIDFIEQKPAAYIQALHRGPYDNMNETLELMRVYAEENGYETIENTHDIYLNDMRKTQACGLKTIMLLKITKEPSIV